MHFDQVTVNGVNTNDKYGCRLKAGGNGIPLCADVHSKEEVYYDQKNWFINKRW